MSAIQRDEFIACLVTGYHSLSVLRRSQGAVIYHALRERTDAPAALKVLRLDDAAGGTAFDDQELSALLRLSAHSNVIAVLGAGVTTTGRPYVAMEYCAEGSYADILSAFGPLQVEEVLEVGAAVAAALAAAHGEGLTHGAVTPGNVLRADSGPVLADFPMSRAPQAGAGRPHHKAPEVLSGGEPTQASDIYGLASTLWTLLAGHPPYADPHGAEPDPFTYRDSALAGPPPSVPGGLVSKALQEVLAKGMAMEPGDRYRDARAFAEALSLPDATVGVALVAEQKRPGWGFFDAAPDLAPPVLVGSLPAPDQPDQLGEPREVGEVGEPARPVTEEAGWLDLPGLPEAEPRYEPDFEPVEQESVPPGHLGPPVKPTYPRTRRSAYIGAAVGGVVLGVVALLVVVGGGLGGPDGKPAGRRTAAVPTPSGTLIEAGKNLPYTPMRVRITDRQIIAALTWQDRSSGKASHYVVGGPAGRTPTTLAALPVGKTAAEIGGLNPTVNYCFTVVAILGVDDVAAAAPVCTKRRT